jgi:hypothetical protein
MALRIRYHLLLLLVLFLSGPLLSVAQDEEPVVDTGESVMSVEATETTDDDDDAAYRGKNEVYETPEFRKAPDSVAERRKKEKEFRYANDPAYWVKEKKKPSEGRSFTSRFYDFFQGSGARTLAYILLAALLIFVIYRVVVVNKLYMVYASKKIRSDEDSESDIHDDDLEDKIQKAVAAKQYREGVRYLYLKTLRTLSEKGLIRLHAQATNYDYVNQMDRHARAEEFRFLTRVYDYVWYGEFTLTDEQFNLVHNNFKNFFDAV